MSGQVELDAGTIDARVRERLEAQALAQAEADKAAAKGGAPSPAPPGSVVGPGGAGVVGPGGEPAPKRANPETVAGALLLVTALALPEEADYCARLAPEEAQALAEPVGEIIDRDYPWLIPWLEEAESPYVKLLKTVAAIGVARHAVAQAKKEAEAKRKAEAERARAALAVQKDAA